MSRTLARERALGLIAELGEDVRVEVEPSAVLADIGFDSLAFAELAAAVEGDAGADLGGAWIDERSTVADVLAAIERGTAAATTPHVRLGRLQRTSTIVGGRGLRWWFDLVVEGADRIPRSGPVVLAMNHESALDIPIAVIASPRPITFMAKRELFKNPVVARSLRELGGFMVDRRRFDLGAVRLALSALGRGEVLGMYPEGTRAPGELRPFLEGAAWLAIMTGAPLVPCAIVGTDGSARPRRARVRVTFEPPIAVERMDDPAGRRVRAATLTSRLHAEIASRLVR